MRYAHGGGLTPNFPSIRRPENAGAQSAISGTIWVISFTALFCLQQRLCIARTIAVKPEVILMDEPCSALDPIATAKIEDLMEHLSQEFTIVIVTHNMQQAAHRGLREVSGG